MKTAKEFLKSKGIPEVKLVCTYNSDFFLKDLLNEYAQQSVTSALQEAAEKNMKATEILRALVNLKEYKVEFGKDEQYLETQPKLWEQAKHFLSLIPKDNGNG